MVRAAGAACWLVYSVSSNGKVPLMPDLSAAAWRKSSFSNAGGNCVEVGFAADGRMVGVRDTKDRSGGVLEVSGFAWAAFLREVKADAFGR